MDLRFSPIPTATSIIGAARSKRSFGGGTPSRCGPICFAPTICSSVPIYAASTRTRPEWQSSARTVFNNEDLNTTYYGGYVGFGGEYSLGFLGTGGPWESLGLRSYFSARAGLYDAAIDYDVAFQFIPVNSRLSLSKDDLAFIGSVSFETRKQSPRTSLSLW